MALRVAEVLGDGETGQGDSGTSSWGLVHLAVDEGDLNKSLVLNISVGSDDSPSLAPLISLSKV